MHMNKIDELIDKYLDDFYLIEVKEKKKLEKIINETEFSRFQQEINNIMIDYQDKISLINKEDVVSNKLINNRIIETIKRYIAFYIFLTIGYFYPNKPESYISNIVEITKNQALYKYKIENFFNSENNAIIIQYNKDIQNIITLLNANKEKLEKIKKQPDIEETIKFLNELGMDYIESKFKNTDPSLRAHNIIKTVIIMLLYNKNDKTNFIKMLDSDDMNNNEYIYITVIVPTNRTINFETIENTLDGKNKYLPYNVWKFFTDYENDKRDIVSNEDKIHELFASRMFVPISDDFLLYHKDNEIYDKNDKNEDSKRDSSRIKYIINKVDKVKDYYTAKDKAEVKKLFFSPYLNRKAVLVNVHEDNNIITKMINTNKNNLENMNYFREFEVIKNYPFISFNDFEKNGFSYLPDRLTNFIRSISFTTTGEFKQNINSVLESRVGVNDMIVNIVGLSIPSMDMPFECEKVKNIENIKSKESENGFNKMVDIIDKKIDGDYNENTLFWMFNTETDKVKKSNYAQEGSLTQQENVREIIVNLYDSIQKILTEKIIAKMGSVDTIKQKRVVKQLYENAFIKIMNKSENFIDLEKNIFESLKEFDNYYDVKDDVYFSHEEFFPPEKIVAKEEKGRVSINFSKIDEYGNLEETQDVDGICQHNIDYDNLELIDNKDFLTFEKSLYKFVQHYVIQDVNEKYVCRSCHYEIDLKKYIEEGEYNNDTKTFVSYSAIMNINLEDIIGYEHLKVVIKQMDKIMDKLASVSNLINFSKNNRATKSRRTLVLKDTIDIINVHNKNLKENKIVSQKTYGINKMYSNMWVFELKNNIFVFSTTDIDEYKPIKTNNAIAYMIFMMLLEMNYNQLTYLGDKKCNINLFDKHKEQIFGDLQIIINKNGDIQKILDYPVLCYVIYIISCSIASNTSLWFYKNSANDAKNVMLGKMQKSIIHTLINIINSVVDVSLSSDDMTYSIIRNKYFSILLSLYGDKTIFKQLLNLANNEKKKVDMEIKNTSNNYILLPKKLTRKIYKEPNRIVLGPATLILPEDETPSSELYKETINNKTNCVDGKFHIWKNDKDKYKCERCGITTTNLEINDTESVKILDKYYHVKGLQTAQNICLVDGDIHIYEIGKGDKMVCVKCHNTIDHEYSDKDIKNVEDLSSKKIRENNNRIAEMGENIVSEIKKENKYINEVLDSLTKDYNSNKGVYVENILSEIQKVLGNKTYTSTYNNITINSHLTENIYTVNYDHLGHSISPPITFLGESKEGIRIHRDNDHFKTDVLYFTLAYLKVDVYYDLHKKILLGYKEHGKHITDYKRSDRTITINYSIKYKLINIGNSQLYYNVSNMYENYKLYNDDEKAVEKMIIENLISNKISLMKKVITKLKVITMKILNNDVPEEIFMGNLFNAILLKYKSQFNDILLSDDKGNKKILKHWKAVVNNVFMTREINIKKDMNFKKNNILYSDFVNDFESEYNMLLYYLCEELTKYYKYNNDIKLKTIISDFIIDFINVSFITFNDDYTMSNFVFKKYLFMLDNEYLIEERSEYHNIEGLVSEYSGPSPDDELEKVDEFGENEEKYNKNYDLKQEDEALDIDIDREDMDESGDDELQAMDLSRYLNDQ